MEKKTVSRMRRSPYQEAHPLRDPQQSDYRVADTQDSALVVS